MLLIYDFPVYKPVLSFGIKYVPCSQTKTSALKVFQTQLITIQSHR